MRIYIDQILPAKLDFVLGIIAWLVVFGVTGSAIICRMIGV